jgi:hypothetical protein
MMRTVPSIFLLLAGCVALLGHSVAQSSYDLRRLIEKSKSESARQANFCRCHRGATAGAGSELAIIGQGDLGSIVRVERAAQ